MLKLLVVVLLHSVSVSSFVHNRDACSEPATTRLLVHESLRQLLEQSKALNDGGEVDEMGMVRTLPGGAFQEKQPRWHSPASPPSDASQIIWRNARKRSSPALWRYALRTFEKSASPTLSEFEGALVACSKLGDWNRSVAIYEMVLEEEKTSDVEVTDSMIESIIRSCVRAARKDRKNREPLDRAVDVLIKESSYVSARQLDAIAAAYQNQGLHNVSTALVQEHLDDRMIGPEPEDGPDRLNIHNMGTKDKGSYSLLVQSAVSTGNWTSAIDALMDMTEAGLYPNQRHIKAWSEISERKTKQRSTRSWKKKREEYWLDSVRGRGPVANNVNRSLAST